MIKITKNMKRERKSPNVRMMSVENVVSSMERFSTDNKWTRNYIWSDDEKENLIENIMDGYPSIGNVIVAPADDECNAYDVMDGKQRLVTISDYLNNRFSCRGKYFCELPKAIRYKINAYPLTVIVVDAVTDEEKRELKEHIVKYC